MGVETEQHGGRLPWGDILLSAIAAVSWALIGMAGVAALGLHLLEADSVASLGPMTAAVVALAAGGSVTPSGDVSAFGLTGAQAATAIEITPLGVSLAGAVLLSWFFLRSLRRAGAVIAPSELLARAGSVVLLFTAMTGGLAWAGHDVVTIDGGALGLDKLPGAGGGGGLDIPGLGDVGDIGGLLPDQVGDLIDAKAAVGFTVDTVPTLLGGLGWSAGILLIALLASRRTPLPPGWDAVHRVVRPAVSALVTVLLVAVAAGLSAAAYAAIGDDHPKRIAGAALLGAPNGVWLGIPIGLFVPFDGRATGVLRNFLPDPLDRLLASDSDQSVTLGRLAELDGRVWLLGVAAALMMLLAGVLTAVRTPVEGAGPAGFAGRCAVRLGLATASALPLLAWLTEVSVDASLSVLGFDAFGAGVVLRGELGLAVLLGAVWGAAAGAAGALLARATGAAGSRAAGLARGDLAGAGVGSGAGTPGGGAAGGPRYAGGAYEPGVGPYAGRSGAYGGQGAAYGGAVYGGSGGVHPAEGAPYGRGAGAREGEVGGPPEQGEGAAGAPWGQSRGYERGAGASGSGAAGYAGAGGPYDDVSRSSEGGGPSYEEGRSYEEGGAGAYEGEARGHRGGAGPQSSQGRGYPGQARRPGPEAQPQRGEAGAPSGEAGPYRGAAGAQGDQGRGYPGQDAQPRSGEAGPYRGGAGAQGRAVGGSAGEVDSQRGGDRSGAVGPYVPGTPYRPPNPATNPYLRVPDELRGPDDDPGPTTGRDAGPSPAENGPGPDRAGPPDDGDENVYGAPTMARPVDPPPRSPRRPARRPSSGDAGRQSPPPPPPPPPGKPKGRR